MPTSLANGPASGAAANQMIEFLAFIPDRIAFAPSPITDQYHALSNAPVSFQFYVCIGADPRNFFAGKEGGGGGWTPPPSLLLIHFNIKNNSEHQKN